MVEEQPKTPESIGEKIGGQIGKEIGKEIEKEVTKHFAGEHGEKKKVRKEKGPTARRFGYVISILFAVLFLWVITSFEAWGWTFITSDWAIIDSIVKFSIYMNLVVFGVFIFYDGKIFYYFGRLLMDTVSIFVSVRMYQVFPFDFTYVFDGWKWLNTVFPWVILLGIAGVGIALIVRTTRFITGKHIYD